MTRLKKRYKIVNSAAELEQNRARGRGCRTFLYR